MPELNATWSLEHADINSLIEIIGFSFDGVKRAFVKALDNSVMQYINNYLKTTMSKAYARYYTLKADKISFPKISKNHIEVIRKPKHLVVTPHSVAVGYHEIAIELDEVGSEVKVTSEGGEGTISTGDGILRRYLRDTIILEKVTEGTLRLLNGYRIRDEDLPKNQTIRLDSTSMQVMIPGFKLYYGDKPEIYMEVSGDERSSRPQVSSLRPQLVDLHGVSLKFDFYVRDNGDFTGFLTALVSFDMVLKPILAWKNDTLSLNFGLESIKGRVLRASSEIFQKELLIDGINSHTSRGMLEFMRGKCPENIMGDGLKIRDELKLDDSVKAMMDISGKIINIWIYKVNSS
eukprot:TRINITY_DN10226_c0_g4_i1.p1 TRINITY_DN10226_c0_g4~~TRINITY_DN10226_c0_g4_i1.p1  ORF type:complete len:366 (-),score=87.73 TRINITY_DN10226_c0_g4_i1:81-1121(-)